LVILIKIIFSQLKAYHNATFNIPIPALVSQFVPLGVYRPGKTLPACDDTDMCNS